MLVKILIGFIIFIILIIVVPIKVEISYLTQDESYKKMIDKIISSPKNDNYAKIYLMSFIPLPKIKLKVNKNKKKLEKQGVTKNLINTIFSLSMELIGMEKIDSALFTKKELKRIISSVYFKKFDLSLGYNLQNIMLNVYFMAIINSLIATFISSKPNMFNLKNLNYQTYISKQIYNLKFYGIVKFNLANTIGIFIKVFIKLRKVANKNGKGSSSNRRFNDDCYDLT